MKDSMNIKTRRGILDHYHCEITDFIFENSSWKDTEKNRTRIYICEFDEKYHAIRITGSTIGFIAYDEANVITDIRLYDDPCWIGYCGDINEGLKQFIGSNIKLEKDEVEGKR